MKLLTIIWQCVAVGGIFTMVLIQPSGDTAITIGFVCVVCAIMAVVTEVEKVV